MGIKIKNLQTGEFEKFNIPALKGERGEPGEIEPSEKVDYIGKQHSKLRDTMNANVDYIIKTAIGEFNYLDYEGQQITATNTLEGHAKSAILKGKTSVNLLNFNSITSNGSKEGDTVTVSANGNTSAWLGTQIYLSRAIERGKKYIAMWNKLEYTHSHANGKMGVIQVLTTNTSTNRDLKLEQTGNDDKNYMIFSCNDDNGDLNKVKIVIQANTWATEEAHNTTIVKGLKVLEYQDGMENWDIPYFEGMQSVKMPILTTTGKNLFQLTFEQGSIYGVEGKPVHSTTRARTIDFIKLTKGNTYTFSVDSSQENSNIMFREFLTYSTNDYNSFKVGNLGTYKKQFTYTPTEDEYIKFVLINNTTPEGVVDINEVKIQIEYGMQATSYEPYKSNILTVNEEVELRGVGDVQDTLDCLTGELTQRIGEVVLDGSENWATGLWKNQVESIGFEIKIKNDVNPSVFVKAISDKLLYDTSNNFQNDGEYFDMVGAGNGETWIRIRILRSKLSTEDVEGFKKWLSQNNVKILYELSDKPIKTVDLSDNVVYSYKGTTHYSCSSEEGSLVPTLSIKVPTDTQLTIQEQKATTQTLLIKNMDLQQSIKEVQAMNLAFNTALYNSFNSIIEEVEDIKKHVSTNENLEGSF